LLHQAHLVSASLAMLATHCTISRLTDILYKGGWHHVCTVQFGCL
jgi:hypothetical protein